MARGGPAPSSSSTHPMLPYRHRSDGYVFDFAVDLASTRFLGPLLATDKHNPRQDHASDHKPMSRACRRFAARVLGGCARPQCRHQRLFSRGGALRSRSWRYCVLWMADMGMAWRDGRGRIPRRLEEPHRRTTRSYAKAGTYLAGPVRAGPRTTIRGPAGP